MRACLYRSIACIQWLWRQMIHGAFRNELRNVNHIERGLWAKVQSVTPKAPNKNPLLMDAIQTKQIMRQSLFIWTSVTQKHKMPLGTVWNGLFAVFVWSFYPKSNFLVVNKEEQKSMCNPFRHEWNLKSMEHYKYFTKSLPFKKFFFFFWKIWILLFSKIDQKLQ